MPSLFVMPTMQLCGNAGWATGRLAADRVLRCDGHTRGATLWANGIVEREWDDPIAALRWLGERAANEDAPARWIGYVSYEAGRLFERFDADPRPDSGTPLFCFGRCERLLDIEAATDAPPLVKVARSCFTKEQYLDAVRRVIRYIEAGDVFQVNLSQQFSAPFSGSAWDLATRMNDATPAAFGGCLDFGDHAVVSNSPELFFEVGSDRVIRTRPIKGTRPRLPGMENELLLSKKDEAELNMIVDLERNDLGRICEIGSVRVEQPRTIEAHPTVYHGVATVAAKLRSNVGFVEVLQGMFPGGSITGAPKIRAMQIIDEIEPVRRGVYCGAMGWLGTGGRMQFNVAIRTIVIRDGVATFSVGGGVVADSNPVEEFEETMVKARAMLGGLNARVE